MSDATYAGGLPQAGWYPDPDVPGQARWWDGYQWYPSQPAYGMPVAVAVAPARIGTGFRWLAGFVQGLILLQLVLLAVALPFWVWGLTGSADRFHGVYGGDLYNAVDLTTAFAGSFTWLGTGVLWCLWQHAVARSAGPGALRRSPGWHVGSWFIPVANLWLPLQNVRDLARHFLDGRAPVTAWWVLWLVGCVTNRSLLVIVMGWDQTFPSRVYNLLSLVDGLLWISCGVLAVVIVRRLSAAALARE